MSELDRSKPFSPVQGDSMAAFYQAGKYFYPDGTELKPEDLGQPSESGSFVNQVQAGVDATLAEINSKKPLTLIDETNPSTNSQADIDAARERAANRDPQDVADDIAMDVPDTRYETLKGMHITVIRKMVVEAGLTPIRGVGSKAKNIELLLENTE